MGFGNTYASFSSNSVVFTELNFALAICFLLFFRLIRFHANVGSIILVINEYDSNIMKTCQILCNILLIEKAIIILTPCKTKCFDKPSGVIYSIVTALYAGKLGVVAK